MLRASIALGDYDIHDGIKRGQVKIPDCDLTVISGLSSPERHWRCLRHEEFDLCELSFGSYLAGLPGRRFVALPVFPHRRFRHHYYFVRTDAGIREPKDLEGRRVGLMTWQATAGIWMRGILQHTYGVDLTRIEWLTQIEEFVAGIHPPVPLTPAPRDIEAMLLDGELDAIFYPETLLSVHRGDPRVGRLFPDSKAEEARYFQATRVFPIMHVLAMKRELAESHPWLPPRVMAAWEASKNLAMERIHQSEGLAVVWQDALAEEERGVLGSDPWAVGTGGDNGHALEAMCQFAWDQGMVDRRYTPDQLFWPAV